MTKAELQHEISVSSVLMREYAATYRQLVAACRDLGNGNLMDRIARAQAALDAWTAEFGRYRMLTGLYCQALRERSELFPLDLRAPQHS